MFKLSEKRVLVTGASGGIGKAIVKALFEAGSEVAISGTNIKKLNELGEIFGQKIKVIDYNLSDIDNISKLVKRSEEALGGNIEILINNAGIARDNLAMRMKKEEWEDVINLNLNSPFFLTKEVIRGMLKARFGRVINISSIIGITGNIGQSNYSASKAGLIGMTKSLALEVASRGITINCIAPGFIKTDMTKKILDENIEKILPMIPLRRVGETIEIANLVRFLASEEAGYITGQTIHINGGMAMV